MMNAEQQSIYILHIVFMHHHLAPGMLASKGPTLSVQRSENSQHTEHLLLALSNSCKMNVMPEGQGAKCE